MKPSHLKTASAVHLWSGGSSPLHTLTGEL
jgi:hypothetical protein